MIIYYNSAILSRLLKRFEATGNAKTLAMLKKISLAVWRHIHLNGHYTFRGAAQVIDLDKIVSGLVGGMTEFSGVPAYISNYSTLS